MPDFRVDSIYNLTAIEEEQAKFLAFLAQSKAAILDLNNQRIAVKSSEVATFTQASQKLTEAVTNSDKAVTNMAASVTAQNNIIKQSNVTLQQNIKNLNDYKNALKDNAAYQKQALKDVEAGKISADEYREKITKLTDAQFKYRQEITKLSATIKAQTQIQNSAPSSIIQAQAQNKILTIQRNALPDSDIEGIKSLNAQIDRNNELIDKNSDLLAKQKINIGNYPINAFSSSFKTLNTELESVKAKLASGTFKGKELDELTGRMNVLKNATALTGQEFATVGQQQKAYAEAATQIGLVYGKDSKVFKEFSAGVNEGSKSIKAITADVSGATTKSKGFGSALGTVYGGLRKLANILPNFGISTAILLLATAFGNAVQAALKFFKTLSDGKIAVQTLNEVNAKSIEIYSKQTSEVTALSEVVKDSSISLNDRKSALEKLIALNPDYLRGLTLENINTDEGRKILDKYNTALEHKAELEAAGVVNANANQAVANLKAERDALVELSKAGEVNFNDLSETQKKYLGNFNTFTANFKFTASLLNTAISKKDISTIIKGIDKEIKTETSKVSASLKIYKQKFQENLTSEGDSVKGIIEKLQEKIAALQKIQPTLLSEADIKNNVAQIKKYQDEIDRLLGKTKAEKAKENKEDQSALLREYLKKDQEQISLYAEQELKSLLDKYKAEYEDQEKSENDRLASLQAYHDTEKALIEKQAQARRDALKVQQTTDLDKAAKIKDIKLQAKTIAAITKEGTDELKNIDADAKRAIQANDIDFSKTTIKIVEDSLKKEEQLLKDHIDILKQLDDQRLNSLLNQSNKGENEKATQLISDSQVDEAGKNAKEVRNIEAALQQRLTILEKQGQLERLEINNAELESEKAKWQAFAALAGEANSYELAQVEYIEAKITENKRKEAELRKGIVTAEVNYEIQKRDELLDKVQQGEEAVLGVIQAFGDASFQRQADDAQKKENLLDEQTQREIELVNASVATEQEKTDKIAIINARAAAEKALLDKQQRKADHDKAVFDKQIAVLQIIAQIAVDIAKGQFFTAALAGAALIKLIATPVPAYRRGRGEGKEELAIVGDGGVSEYIMRGDGMIEKTPAVNTLTHLMPKDRVLPNKQALMKELMLGSMQLSNYSVGNDGGITKNDIERMTNRIEQAVNGIKVPPSTQITKQGWRMVNEKNAKYDQWVNDKIKN